ncbi:hypothetical protein L9F63_023356, partial [Diploptera punctata]
FIVLLLSFIISTSSTSPSRRIIFNLRENHRQTLTNSRTIIIGPKYEMNLNMENEMTVACSAKKETTKIASEDIFSSEPQFDMELSWDKMFNYSPTKLNIIKIISVAEIQCFAGSMKRLNPSSVPSVRNLGVPITEPSLQENNHRSMTLLMSNIWAKCPKEVFVSK